jgi:mRNA interferase MazF
VVPGDIYLVEIPVSGGHEQSGTRPAVILQEPSYSGRLSTVLVVPLTSQIKALNFPGTLRILPDTLNHLQKESVALAFQLRAIDRRRLKARLGTLDADTLAKIKSAIKDLINL